MGLFNTNEEKEHFRQQLTDYFILKKDEDVTIALHNAKLEFMWYSYDKWDGGFDIYNLTIEVPLSIFIKLENRLTELASQINKIANHLMPGNDQIGSTVITLQQNAVKQQVIDQELLMLIEKVKTSLIAKATGQNPNENEYKNYRKAFLEQQNLSILIPPVVKHYSNLAEF